MCQISGLNSSKSKSDSTQTTHAQFCNKHRRDAIPKRIQVSQINDSGPDAAASSRAARGDVLRAATAVNQDEIGALLLGARVDFEVPRFAAVNRREDAANRREEVAADREAERFVDKQHVADRPRRGELARTPRLAAANPRARTESDKRRLECSASPVDSAVCPARDFRRDAAAADIADLLRWEINSAVEHGIRARPA